MTLASPAPLANQNSHQPTTRTSDVQVILRPMVLGLIILLMVQATGLQAAGLALAKEDTLTLYFFYGATCPHCHQAERFLQGLQQRHPGLQISSFEVFNNQENAQQLLGFLKKHGQEASIRVPAIFINNQVIIGYLSDETTG